MWDQVVFAFVTLFASSSQQNWLELAWKIFPFVVVLEASFFLLVTAGMVRYGLRRHRPERQRERYPRVSCVVTCYSEGEDVRKTIQSLAQQLYPGHIEIIAVIDGAIQNRPTLLAARNARRLLAGQAKRNLVVLPKWQRGGRVSSLNAGLSIATGEIVMALDGDTSFDNDMVRNATRHFDDPGVVGVSGNLRVRNAKKTLVTRLQALEYILSIGAGKTGLSEFNIVNNISGAFGVFRTGFIRNLGGWDAGSAEDLDMTMRIKQYFGRHPGLRIVFDPHAVGHTDAPDTWRIFFRQRLRWDGDMFFIFIRKFRFNLRPRLLGWRSHRGAGVHLPGLLAGHHFLLFALCDRGFGAPQRRPGLRPVPAIDAIVRVCQSPALCVLHLDGNDDEFPPRLIHGALVGAAQNQVLTC